MKVIKFGGTSVGSAQRMKNMVDIVVREGKVMVVLSAMSGTTNSLISITDKLKNNLDEEALSCIGELEKKYTATVDELLPSSDSRAKGLVVVDEIMGKLRGYAGTNIKVKQEKEIVAFGEKLSTRLVNLYMRERGLDVILLDAAEFMRIKEDGEPDTEYIKKHITDKLDSNPSHMIYLTQGFICRNHIGEIDNLQRGGSDYTASLIGSAINADEIQIWTDIDGMHNNDPRFVEGTAPVHELHFEEAAELAYFGAKILHPTCVQPAKSANIPVRLLNTMQPDAPGTVIYNTKPDHKIKAIAAKDNITAIKIKSSRMLLAYGFLRKVFEIFEKHHTAIDMITTSEVGVSVTIDNEDNIDPIINELSQYGAVTVDRDMVIICVVGDLEWQNRGFEAKVVDALRNVPVRMISYGGSNYNISLLVKKEDKIRSLQLLSEHLF